MAETVEFEIPSVKKEIIIFNKLINEWTHKGKSGVIDDIFPEENDNKDNAKIILECHCRVPERYYEEVVCPTLDSVNFADRPIEIPEETHVNQYLVCSACGAKKQQRNKHIKFGKGGALLEKENNNKKRKLVE